MQHLKNTLQTIYHHAIPMQHSVTEFSFTFFSLTESRLHFDIFITKKIEKVQAGLCRDRLHLFSTKYILKYQNTNMIL